MTNKIIKFISNHIILITSWILTFVSLIIIYIKEIFYNIKHINTTKTIYLINKKDATIIDLRSKHEFKTGHIINSINITKEEIKKENIKKLKINTKKPIILISKNGIKIFHIAEKLKKNGFENVFILKDGIVKWYSENLPLVKSKK